MAGELKFSGNKTLKKLYKEFNDIFPYLQIRLYDQEQYEKTLKGESVHGYPIDKTISEIRLKKNTDELEIHGKTLVKNLEARILEIYGLRSQICYTPKNLPEGTARYYTSGSTDDMTLSALNRKGEEEGWRKGKN